MCIFSGKNLIFNPLFVFKTNLISTDEIQTVYKPFAKWKANLDKK